MKIFRFAKKLFFVGLKFLSNFTNVISLNCISMKNQKCKTKDHKLLMLIVIIPYFTLLVLKRVNVVVIVITLTIHM